MMPKPKPKSASEWNSIRNFTMINNYINSLEAERNQAMTTAQKAVGFKIPRRTARLVFQDAYEGAEVVVRLDVSVGTFLEIQELVDAEKQLRVFQLFGDTVLDSWNIMDDDGKSIPANGKGMNLIPIDLANIILSQWAEVATGVEAPLEMN